MQLLSRYSKNKVDQLDFKIGGRSGRWNVTGPSNIICLYIYTAIGISMGTEWDTRGDIKWMFPDKKKLAPTLNIR